MPGRTPPGSSERAQRLEIIDRYEAGENAAAIAKAVKATARRVTNIVLHHERSKRGFADIKKARAFLYGERVSINAAHVEASEAGDTDASRVRLAALNDIAKQVGADAPTRTEIDGPIELTIVKYAETKAPE